MRAENPRLETALELAKQGMPVTLAGGPDGKNPAYLLPKEWQHKVWSEEEILSAFAEHPYLNVGIQLGPKSGLIDIEWDSDDQYGKFAELFDGCEVKTRSFRTQKGEHHLFKWHPALEELGAGTTDYKKLGIRLGGGGLAAHSCIPPSVNEDGTLREWINECEPADLPETVVQRIVKAHASKGSKKELKPNSQPLSDPAAIEERIAAAIKGMLGRHIVDANDGSKRLFSYCCAAVEHDLTDDQTIQAIAAVQEIRPFPRAWTNTEILTRLRDAERAAQRGKCVCNKPRIDVGRNDLEQATRETWEAIHLANGRENPILYRHAGGPVRIERADNGEPIIVDVDVNRLTYHVSEMCYFYKHQKRGDDFAEVAQNPPLSLVKNLLATPDMNLPVLTRICEAPVFAASGELQTVPGYHAASQTFYSPADGFVVPEISDSPTESEIAEARRLICGELLGDFPFVSDAEKAHAVAALLLPFARDLITGSTPLHLVEKPQCGTGATLLVEALTYPSTGRHIATMTECNSDEEFRKKLTAKLITGSSHVFIDNLARRLDFPSLASAITSPTWEDRRLGGSEMVKIPTKCVWLASGNNPAVSSELARRIVRIRLDAKRDRPWEGRTFRHPNLRGWFVSNRSQLVWAALTLIKAWVSAGRKPGSKSLGMFESWAKVLSGILEHAGINGLLGNVTEFYDASDEEAATWRAFLGMWWSKHGSEPVQARDILPLAVEDAGLDLGHIESKQNQKLGHKLSAARDRIFQVELAGVTTQLRIDNAGSKSHSKLWRLRPVQDELCVSA